MEEKYRRLFSLLDTNHCIEFREIIRRLSKAQLDQEVLVETLGDESLGPEKESRAAAIMLVYHFLHDVEHKKLFRLLDCCITEKDKKKVEKRIRSIDAEHFTREFLRLLSGNPNDDYPSVQLAKALLKELSAKAYQQKVEEVLAMF